MAPKLPLRPGKSFPSKLDMKTRNLYPLEDNIYTGLKPEIIVNKFYPCGGETTTAAASAEPIYLPADFMPKVFVNNETILGLQHGKIVQFHREKKLSTFSAPFQDSQNRQFYELIPFSKQQDTFLAFQDSGTIFKVTISTNSFDLSVKMLLRDSIPMGSFCKVLIRPGTDEIWVVGSRETAILLLNQSEIDVALIRKVSTHFPEAVSVTFLGAEELAVVKSDRSIGVYSVARHSHQPALIGKLPSTIGDLVKIFKPPNLNALGTIYADGKMIIWRFYRDELVEKITVPLTLFRIQTVHIPTTHDNGILWLGLSNGKLLLVQLSDPECKVSILGEAKYHQSALVKFLTSSEIVVSLDSSGQVCTWDESLAFYKQSNMKKVCFDYYIFTLLDQKMWEMEADYCKYARISVRLCSWNVAAQNPFDCSDSIVSKWLGFDETFDLLVVSLQEIVDLNARTFIQATPETGIVDLWIKFLQKRIPAEYKLVHSSEMVGLALIVFSREALRSDLSSVSDGSVKTGLGGLHGNKGALVWRAFIHDCPVAFVACHLAAGQNCVSERNNDAATILRTASLSEATKSRKDPFAFFTGNSGTRIFDHSAIFLAGDLNYRIEMDRSDCLNKISSGRIEELREADQLGKQMKKMELLLSYFQENCPEFLPTYKYNRGTFDQFDSSEKARVPAWCDRILFYCKPGQLIQCKAYESVPEATLSDHKPIHATFEIKCRKIDHQVRENIFRNFK